MKVCNTKLVRIVVSVTFSVLAVVAPLFQVQQTAYAEDTNGLVESGYDENFYSMNDILYYDPRTTACGYLTTSTSSDVEYTSAVEKTFTLGTDEAARPANLARQLMKDFSLTEAQAAGIVGNFMWESGGKSLPPDINEGGSAGPPKFSGGYGWAQWTGGRQKTFIKFAIEKGYMASNSEHATDAANYAYLKYELVKTERSTIPAVQKATDPTAAATAFEANFERAGIPRLEKRIEYAKELYATLTGGGTGSTVSSDCAQIGSGLVGEGQVFDSIVFPLSARQSDIKNGGIFKNGTTARGGHPYIAFDIYAKAGTQVVAMAEGKITYLSKDGSMGGGIAIYNATKKLHVFYTHLRPLGSLKMGQEVSPGTPLGSLISVKDYPSINTDHLHIDAGTGTTRLGCSRTNSSGAACKTRVDIGPDLYNAWELLEK